ncbi:hypothetical protein V8J36_21895 [Frigidibacter sp. MR17.14]|uniref:hypothetical protein n=1 Tax=Frigidibacter sp. MR17.14 TaxID=3126509 RepID=UPI003012D6A4
MPIINQRPVVLRMAAFFPSALTRYEGHRQRKLGDVEHCDPQPDRPNQVIHGEEDWLLQLQDRIRRMSLENYTNEVDALQRRRRRAEAERRAMEGPKDPWKATDLGPLREVILTAHHAWFEEAGRSAVDELLERNPDASEGDRQAAFAAGKANREDAFVERGRAWLRDAFGEALVHARVDLDESACHIHAVLMVATEKTSSRRGRQQLIQPSAHPLVKDYERAQDEVARAFEDLGLHRGAARAQDRRLAVGLERVRSEAEGRAFDVTAIPEKRRHVPPAKWRAREREEIAQERATAEHRRARQDEVHRRKRETEKDESLAALAASLAERRKAEATRRQTEEEHRFILQERVAAKNEHRRAMGRLAEREARISADLAAAAADRKAAEDLRTEARNANNVARAMFARMQAALRLLSRGEAFGYDLPDPAAPGPQTRRAPDGAAAKQDLADLADVMKTPRLRGLVKDVWKAIFGQRQELEQERTRVREVAAAVRDRNADLKALLSAAPNEDLAREQALKQFKLDAALRKSGLDPTGEGGR